MGGKMGGKTFHRKANGFQGNRMKLWGATGWVEKNDIFATQIAVLPPEGKKQPQNRTESGPGDKKVVANKWTG